MHRVRPSEPASPMIESNLFIALSWDPASAQEGIARTRKRLDDLSAGWWRSEKPGRLICSQPTAFHATGAGAALCLNRRRAIGADGTAYDADSLSALIHRQTPLDALGMAAPFAAAWFDPADGVVRTATDPYGIGQLFVCEGEGIAGVSNSASFLARIFGQGLDRQALTGFALFGAFQRCDTPYAGVEKTSPDKAIVLRHGRRMEEAIPRIASSGSTGSGLAGLGENLRGIVRRQSDAAPEADLQLSGGLDSRLILAALPPDRRKRHRAFTIGTPDSPDVRIASAICEHLGMRHKIVDVASFDTLDADGLHQIFERAAIGFDRSANPVDKAAQLLIEPQIDCGVWFNGQNGELIRGFYYPGQPLDAKPSAALARRLLDWRLTSNDMVDPRLFPADEYAALRARAEETAVATLMSFDGSWSMALDRYYLTARMQRWAGNGIDNLINSVGYLCPFFDPAFVEPALAMRADDKLYSRGAYRILAGLDRALASFPLDSGIRPLTLVEAPLQARFGEVAQFWKKAAAKVKGKLSRHRRAVLGSSTAATLWHRHGLYRRLPHSAMVSTGFFDSAALEDIVSGRWLPDRPTLGFVLMMAALVEGTG